MSSNQDFPSFSNKHHGAFHGVLHGRLHRRVWVSIQNSFFSKVARVWHSTVAPPLAFTIYCLTHFKGESNCDVRFSLFFFCIFLLLLWKKMWRIKVGVNKSNPELNTYCSDRWWACTMLCILIPSLKRHPLSQTGTNLQFETNCDISLHNYLELQKSGESWSFVLWAST